ncbi:MAG: phosphatidylserine/phosphatidylglycerophosphate/cardiolipin synthase family protein [Verrucomicrobiota bacterium]|nr:phosphatidylserine/phosphatidylglycerophosphate/cardiolipin synthase family protein [Verrucomicrobiota bacterium]
MDSLSVFFLSQDDQTAEAVLARLISYIAAAKESLDFALYDLRLDEPLLGELAAALHERAVAGVQVRICYDGDKPPVPDLAGGQDPAPPGTGATVQSLGFPFRRIAGMKLMHHKFIVRDREAVWTGSLNLTNDAFTLMENNVVQLESPALAAAYAADFEELWEKENFEESGKQDVPPVTMTYAGEPAVVQLWFSPGRGLLIDAEVAKRVRGAQRRVRICSLLLNSGTLINALTETLDAGRVAVSGIYDRTQMSDVYRQWDRVPSNRWKVPALHDVIARAKLVGKDSTPYSPTGRHDFMHNKILVVDDTVITGSYNFSRSAQFNAENILFIESAALAQTYSVYIDRVMQKYAGEVER